MLAQKGANGERRSASPSTSPASSARRLGVPVELVTFDAAGKAFDALKRGVTDIGFLAIEPVRAAEVDFTAPYVLIEGTYMVPKDSPLKTDRGRRLARACGSRSPPARPTIFI